MSFYDVVIQEDFDEKLLANRVLRKRKAKPDGEKFDVLPDRRNMILFDGVPQFLVDFLHHVKTAQLFPGSTEFLIINGRVQDL